jgi:hypothetical protein
MPTQLTVSVEDRPGAAAEVAEAVAREGINIDAVCCVPSGATADLYLVVEDASAARQALGSAGLSVSGEQEVLLHQVEDRPGVLAEVTRRAADAGVNLGVLYLAAGTRLVIGADDLDALRGAVEA